jgi:hypothetical protein
MVCNPFHRWKHQYGIFNYLQIKGQAISSQAWAGPEDSRRVRFPDLSSAHTVFMFFVFI